MKSTKFTIVCLGGGGGGGHVCVRVRESEREREKMFLIMYVFSSYQLMRMNVTKMNTCTLNRTDYS